LCIGERDAADQQSSQRSTKFEREVLKIVFFDASIADEKYGGSGDVVVLEGELLKPPNDSKTILIFMHPSAQMNVLPLPVALAKSGVHVCTACSRYPNNDSTLIMERCLLDLGQYISHLKKKLGYVKVVLCGWSGGGSLSTYYQAESESPTVTNLPSGEPFDIAQHALTPADGLMLLAAHTSRARIFTEWLDPAVLDERDPSQRDADLDLYGTAHQAPFDAAFLLRYREAQVARNRRITAWVKQRLAAITAESQTAGDWRQRRRDEGFVVHCTQADPRRLDVKLDPSDRPAATIGALSAENNSPAGLGRFCTLRSWLSQWSCDESRADTLRCMPRVRAPVLIVGNGADHLCCPSNQTDAFGAVSHSNKELYVVRGASHYYLGQRDKLDEAVGVMWAWLTKQGFLGELRY